jgi:hypothetical protein
VRDSDKENLVITSLTKTYNSPAKSTSKIGCEECVLEKWRHNQTKKALNRAIGLSHRLMQEIRKLEGTIANLEQQRKSDDPVKDPKKPLALDEWVSNHMSQVAKEERSVMSEEDDATCNSKKGARAGSESTRELKALTKIIQESRKSMQRQTFEAQSEQSRLMMSHSPSKLKASPVFESQQNEPKGHHMTTITFTQNFDR